MLSRFHSFPVLWLALSSAVSLASTNVVIKNAKGEDAGTAAEAGLAARAAPFALEGLLERRFAAVRLGQQLLDARADRDLALALLAEAADEALGEDAAD